MPKQSAKSTDKRRKRDEEDDCGESDDDIQPVHFFVPGENINAAVLVEYINRYVDRTAKITSAQHPTDKTRTGFVVMAKRAVNAVSIRDIINDSRDWDLETNGREYRRDPYDYRESDTAKRRAKKGPSEGGTNRPQQPRGKREGTAEAQDAPRQDAPRQERPPLQSTASGGNPQPQYQTQYSQYSYGQPQNPTSSYGYQAPRSEQGGTNINITFAPSKAGQAAQAAQYPSSGSYNTSGYAPPPKQESDPPPAYQPPATNRGGGSAPQPPSQPGPDVFDREEKPVTSRTQGAQDRRASTFDQQGRRSGR